MRKRIVLVSMLAIIMLLGLGIYSCNKDGVQWPGSPDIDAGPIPTGDYVDRFALGLTDDPDFGLIVLNEGGEGLVATTVLDAQGAIVDIEGAILIASDGSVLVVRFADEGWPKHAVYNGYVYFFTNWTIEGVDVAVVAPDGSYEIYSQTPRVTQGVVPLGKPYHPDRIHELIGSQDTDTLEKLPIPSELPFQLSVYGRSMQAYAPSIPPYSIPSYSLMPNRTYGGDGSVHSWAQWVVVGTSLVAKGFPELGFVQLPATITNAEIVMDGEEAVMNPYLIPSRIKLTGGACQLPGLSDVEEMYCAVYGGATNGFSMGRTTYNQAIAVHEDDLQMFLVDLDIFVY